MSPLFKMTSFREDRVIPFHFTRFTCLIRFSLSKTASILSFIQLPPEMIGDHFTHLESAALQSKKEQQSIAVLFKYFFTSRAHIASVPQSQFPVLQQQFAPSMDHEAMRVQGRLDLHVRCRESLLPESQK